MCTRNPYATQIVSLGYLWYNQTKQRHEKALIVRKQICGKDHVYVETLRSLSRL